MTLNIAHRLCKVIDFGTNRKRIYIFLFLFLFGGGDSRVVASRISKQEGPGSIPGGGKEV